MCLILFAVDAHPGYQLVLAANRDESHARPTSPAAFWDDAPDVFGGRDLLAGGTWLGVTRKGRFAALTNVRSPSARREGLSRGVLVSSILRGTGRLDEDAARAAKSATSYASFNLLIGEGSRVFYVRDDGSPPELVVPGVHGLSNAPMDVPWPKVERGKHLLAAEIESQSTVRPEVLFDALRDRGIADDSSLPQTGVPVEIERLLSASFIVSDVYGTRSSTVLLIGRDGRVEMEERSFTSSGAVSGIVHEAFISSVGMEGSRGA